MKKTAATLAVALLAFCLSAPAQTLQFDGDTTTAGIQNGGGTWDTTTTNWWLNGDPYGAWQNNGSAIAAFGVMPSNNAASTINVSGTINLAGLIFNPLSVVPNKSLHTFNGGNLSFADNAFIEFGDNSTITNNSIIFNSTVTAKDLTLRRNASDVSTSQAAVSFAAAGAHNLTGTLTVAALDSTVGVFALLYGSTSGLDHVIVEDGSVFGVYGANLVHEMDLTLNGVGGVNGALRIAANSTFTGDITLGTENTAIVVHNATTGIVNGAIKDGGLARNLELFSTNANGVMRLSGANTYGGATLLGVKGTTSIGLVLDFSEAAAPASNILYNQGTPGDLELWGRNQGKTTLTLLGKSGSSNSQHFDTLSVNTSYSRIVLQPGADGGMMELSFTGLTQTGNLGALRITNAPGGSITTTMADGLVGPWATYTDAGNRSGWAAVKDGTLTHFTGDLEVPGGSTLAATPDLTSDSHLALGLANLDTTLSLGETVTIGTLTQGSPVDRALDLGAGNFLSFGTMGGIQLTAGSGDLHVSGGTITGDTSASQLYLTNVSELGQLRISSVIANNTGTLSVGVNGTGNTVLDGPNTFSGLVHVNGGATLEVRHNNALGTTGSGTHVHDGSSIRIGGGITLAEPFFINGTGANNDGAIRILDGDNILNASTTLYSPASVLADAGSSLTIAGAATTNRFTGTQNLTLGGLGDITVNGRIATSTGTVTKTGNGRLTLAGDNTYTGSATVSGGILRVAHNNGLGTTAGSTTVNANSTLELGFASSGTVGENIIFSGHGFPIGREGNQTSGAIRNVQGNNTLSGTLSIATTPGTVYADAGTSLTIAGTLRTGATSGTSVRAAMVGGAGDIILTGSIINGATSARTTLVKKGAGTLHMRSATTYTGSTVLQGGRLNLDFANATPTSSLIVGSNALFLSDGILQVSGKAGAANQQGFATTQLGTAIGTGSTGATLTTFNVADNSGGFGGGITTLQVNPGAGGTARLDLGVLLRAPKSGSAVNLVTPAAGAMVTTTTLDINGILNGGMTVDKTTWATSAATQTTDVAWSNTGDTINLSGFTNGTQVSFTGTAPAGLAVDTAYYVVNATGSNFKVATTPGGSAINLTNDGTTAAMNRGGAITGLAAGSYATTFAENANVDVAAASTTVPAVAVNSLRFNDNSGADTVLSLSGTLTNLSGGILITENNTGNITFKSDTTTARTFDLGTSNTTLNIHHHGSGVLTLESTISFANTQAITKTGVGMVDFRATALTPNMHLRVLEGTFNVLGNSRFSNSSTYTDLTIGTATTSATVSFGNGGSTGSLTFNAIRVPGTGSSLVGNGTAVYEINFNGGGIQDLTRLMIGGSGTGQNNLSLAATLNTTVQFGPANTYAGKTNIGRAIFEASVLADAGQPSSFGTGSLVPAIEINNTSSSVASESILRYVGNADSSTNRALRLLTNGDAMTSILAAVENVGTGMVKFTSAFTVEGSTTRTRQFRLGGTNTGLNEMVSITDGTQAASIVSLKKDGIGTWALTGNSTYTGTTTITEGILQLGTGGTSGTVGSGIIDIAAAGSLVTHRSNTLTLANEIMGAGRLIVNNAPAGVTGLTGSNTYSGGTFVNSGTLLASNTLPGSATGTGSVWVEDGARLGGSGQVGLAGSSVTPVSNISITIAGGHLRVGDTHGEASGTASTLTLQTGGNGSTSGTLTLLGTVEFDIFNRPPSGESLAVAAATANNDLLILSSRNPVILGGTLQVANSTGLSTDSWEAGDSWQIIDWYGIFTDGGSPRYEGTFTDYELPSLANGLQWDISQLYTTGFITIAIPEPGRMSLLGLALATLLLRRRRSKME
ncbi:autotransporter-associated beta strand repeat-containing protein [Prosthecobacter sp. SYSU 5D2]|uniref:beta strand repeat-containing protein n=1 Tax=Prosthecobacter sp. SYSU 5D2 TaxID=3134134 RepID=UPI0031FEA3D7